MNTDSTPEEDTVADRVHRNSWSANLEGPEHAEDRDLVVREAIRAIEHTVAGYHVNLVTHENHGHPSSYLYDELDERFGSRIDVEYVDQCGCGGHATRVHVGAGIEEGPE